MGQSGMYSNLAVLWAVCTSLLFGYQLAVLNPTIKFFTLKFGACGDHFTYNCEAATTAESYAVSAVVAGATVGCFAIKPLLSYSRRWSFFLCHIISIVGAVMTILASNFLTFGLARLVSGLAVGILCVVSPTWISEFSPAKLRGSLGVLHQLAIVIGIFLANAVGYLVTQPPEFPDESYVMSKWDSVTSVTLVAFPGIVSVAIIMALLFCTRDDSPIIYVQRGASACALTVLRKIYDTPEEAQEALEALEIETRSTGSVKKLGFSALLRKPGYGWCLFVGCVLAAGQQVGGVSAFVTQSSNLFHDAGLSPETCVKMSTAMSIINLVMTFPPIFIIDRLGRKPLLLIGIAGQVIFLAMPVFYALMGWNYSFAAAIAVLGFMGSFAVAYGPVLWVYLFEMFPADMKDTGASIGSGVNWLFNCLTVYLARRYSTYVLVNFSVYATLSAALFFFVLFFMKETKGALRCPYLSDGNGAGDESKPLFSAEEA